MWNTWVYNPYNKPDMKIAKKYLKLAFNLDCDCSDVKFGEITFVKIKNGRPRGSGKRDVWHHAIYEAPCLECGEMYEIDLRFNEKYEIIDYY